MRNLLIVLGFLVPMFIVGGANDAETQVGTRPRVDPAQPIQITADRLDAYHDKRVVVFSGNCVANQGERTIRADRLTLTYREDRTSKGRPVTDTAAAGSLEKVEAAGRVQITERDRVVTGDAALFDQETQRITVTGSAVLREGAHIVRGERIVVFLNENRGVVESTDNKRVSATIYPAEEQGTRP
jgi:lipopolysaccharide export system protein LptA